MRRRYVPQHRRPKSRPGVPGLALLVASAALATTTTYGFSAVTAGADDRAAGSAATTSPVPGRSDAAPSGGNGSATEPGVGSTAAAGAPTTVAEQGTLPAFVRVPTIGATSPLIRLGLTADGSMEVPEDFSVAGWYTGGARPGEQGPAIIAGHLDSYTGPGIFSKLRQVKPGDPITVTRVDGVELEFVATRVDEYPKSAFPTEAVYGRTERAELRLITCGGRFDRSSGQYDDNIVVYARLAERA